MCCARSPPSCRGMRPPATSGRDPRIRRLLSKHWRGGSRRAKDQLTLALSQKRSALRVPTVVRSSRDGESPGNPSSRKLLPTTARMEAMAGRGSERAAEYVLRPSKKGDKKWVVVDTSTGAEVHFGHPDYEDYTTHRDDTRKQLYLKRHAKRENWSDLRSAGAWARHLLWAEPTLDEAIKQMQRRFNIKIRRP